MGTVKFKAKTGQKINETDFCEPNLNLLAHAQALELNIGSRCGGHGICGGDKVRVTLSQLQSLGQSVSPLTAAEKEHLSQKELESGYRLACQCYPNSSELELQVEFSPS
ncbi:MAG: 2Fe-2S iron-sulfur cluster-binding protein [Oligoflexia bacterium]|jgi:ferredoxin